MKHGLGDNAQFTIVLRHIKHYFPSVEIDMEIGIGKESYFKKYTTNLFQKKRDYYDYSVYDHLLDVRWPIPGVCLETLPSTKPARFVKDVLKVEPIERLFRSYDITITDEERELADGYIKKLPNKFVLLHYTSKTLKHRKSLTDDDAAFLCLKILKMGLTPVILDWKGESPLPDQKRIFNPGIEDPIWKGDLLPTAGTTAALINKAALYIGIDSGPLHIAGCTKTPSIGIWYGHHPINFFDLCDNVTHMVPKKSRIRGKMKENGIKYFEKKYKYAYYDNLSSEIIKVIESKI